MLPTQEALFQRRQLFKRKVSPEQSSCLSVIHLPLALDRSFIHKYISEDSTEALTKQGFPQEKQ